jgi:hypothetical protein
MLKMWRKVMGQSLPSGCRSNRSRKLAEIERRADGAGLNCLSKYLLPGKQINTV